MIRIADQFMRRHGMHPDSIDMLPCCEAFMAEMQRGLSGQRSSLMMLPTYISLEHRISEGQRAVILDAGGTNLRIGKATYRNRDFCFTDLSVSPIPGSAAPVTWEQFTQEIAKRMRPLLSDTDRFGFCFSFPAQATEELDGTVIAFNKEVAVSGAEGEPICGGLCGKLAQYGVRGLRFALINDTVATLLGGYGMTCAMDYDGYIGFVLGTGTNCSYVERTERITKLPAKPAGNMIVNMEAGGYGLFPLGELDKVLDRASQNPGDHLYEKMVSGVYLGELAERVLREAAAEQVFAGNLQAQVLEQVNMETVSAFLTDPSADTPLARFSDREEDLDLIFALLDLLLDRAAKMVAVNLVSILAYSDMGRSSARPACIIAEGSTFVKSIVYQSKILKYTKLLADIQGRSFAVLSFDDVNLKGAATAAMLAE